MGVELTLDDIVRSRQAVSRLALRTPLVHLSEIDSSDTSVYLKLENLQPTGSFKIRGAGNALNVLGDPPAAGVYTASAGNMGRALAYLARQAGWLCHAVVPDHAPRAKLDPVERYGATVIPVPFEEWWSVIEAGVYPPLADAAFIHPFLNPAVMAGNGTIGQEIVDDLPDVQTIIIPWGGGGLTAGIATAAKALRPSVRVMAVEVSTAAPLCPALEAGQPVTVTYTPTFVDGIGSPSVLSPMLGLASRLVDGVIHVSPEQAEAAVVLLAERAHIVAEGAAACAVAAALSEQLRDPVACIISGGNIDLTRVAHMIQDHAGTRDTEEKITHDKVAARATTD